MNRGEIKIEKVQHGNEEIVAESRRDGEDHDEPGGDRASDKNQYEYFEIPPRSGVDRQLHRMLLFVLDLSIVKS